MGGTQLRQLPLHHSPERGILSQPRAKETSRTTSTRTRALGLAGVLVTALATLTIANAPAQTAGCTAPSGESCLRIINNTNQIRSLSEGKTNRCLLGIHPGRTRAYNAIKFDRRDHLGFWGFTGSNCEGNTVNTVWWGDGWAGPDSGNYLSTTLYNG
ncbi:hypothetical protein OG205_16600 [Lentzea sp. NBC_00516]|uniref:hypothetical protein n=1 Tax=Lentzea sp. NBC_00516 TaxID=2903582 RepID=UPI002E812DFB|nr:hypothetical protein [Lentzea sp. NBC_00516]WUD28555.1 hypothetical protein OG205_16600 [Lentzea sp. NBC_00516]